MDATCAFRDMTLAINELGYCPGCYEFFDFFPPPRTITAFSKTFSLKKRRLVQEHSSVCQLCLHVHRFLKDGYGPDYDLPDKPGDQYDVNIEASKCFLSGMSKDPFSSIGFTWKISPKVRPLKLAVWASKGTPASKLITTRPPLLDDDPAKTATHIKEWLHHCIEGHPISRPCLSESCDTSMEAGPVTLTTAKASKLPTRVLSITKDATNHISIKLIESKDSHGSYCALSHCWGPINKQPLRTTRQTLAARMTGIAFDQLPATFRDAVYLVLTLQIEYLWIDSLCIVQDDPEEWLRESENMGSIYKNATLVLAAAGSRDSTEGLFITKRPHPEVFTLPYSPYSMVTGRAASSQGEYNLAILPQEPVAPSHGPLHQRAWAYQEWYFANRKVLFMPGGISWACSHREYNEQWNYSKPQVLSSSWLALLSEYTGKVLTYPSDRLVAIRGIATETTGASNLFRHMFTDEKTASAEKDASEGMPALEVIDSMFKFGVWKAQLLEQLLWLPIEMSNEDEYLPELPTWSWAASGGGKRWPLSIHNSIPMRSESQNDIATLELLDSGLVKAKGQLLSVETAPLQVCCVAHLSEEVKHASIAPSLQRSENIELAFSMLNSGEPEKKMNDFLMLDPRGPKDGKIFGIARLDRNIPTQNVHFLVMASVRRPIFDICNLHFQGDGLIHRAMRPCPCNTGTDTHGHGSCSKCSSDGCTDLLTAGSCDTVYWGLLLESDEITSTRLKRVGIGFAYPSAVENQNSDVGISSIEII